VGPFSPGLPIRCIGTGFAPGYPSADGPLPGLQKALGHEQDYVKELLTQDTRAPDSSVETGSRNSAPPATWIPPYLPVSDSSETTEVQWERGPATHNGGTVPATCFPFSIASSCYTCEWEWQGKLEGKPWLLR